MTEGERNALTLRDAQEEYQAALAALAAGGPINGYASIDEIRRRGSRFREARERLEAARALRQRQRRRTL
jgi:hypothetical protein